MPKGRGSRVAVRWERPVSHEVAYGAPVESGDVWAATASEFTPEKSLARIAEKARFTVATVSLVGTVLTGLGLVSAERLSDSLWSRWCTIAAVALAAASVVLALSYLTLRVRALNPYNLLDVETFVTEEFRRSRRVVVATWLLVAALVVAAVGAVLVLAVPAQPVAAATLSTSGAGVERSIQGAVRVSELREQDPVVVTLTLGKGPQRVLFRSTSIPTDRGTVQVDVPSQPGITNGPVELSVVQGDTVLAHISSE